jgi:hypothetical protein
MTPPESALDVGVSGARVGQSKCQGHRTPLASRSFDHQPAIFVYAADCGHKNEKLLGKTAPTITQYESLTYPRCQGR